MRINEIARETTHPCLPVAHDDSTFGNPHRHEETIENMAEFLSNSDEPFSPTSEFSCIQISKTKNQNRAHEPPATRIT